MISEQFHLWEKDQEFRDSVIATLLSIPWYWNIAASTTKSLFSEPKKIKNQKYTYAHKQHSHDIIYLFNKAIQQNRL